MIRFKEREKSELIWQPTVSLQASWLAPQRAVPFNTLLKMRFKFRGREFETFLFKESSTYWDILFTRRDYQHLSETGPPPRSHWRLRETLNGLPYHLRYGRRSLPEGHPARQTELRWLIFRGTRERLTGLDITEVRILLPKNFKATHVKKRNR